MKLTVEISRKTDGSLRASVIQEGVKGPDMAHGAMKVGTARERTQVKLAGHDIEWIGESPDADLKHATDIKKITTKRDEYGLGDTSKGTR